MSPFKFIFITIGVAAIAAECVLVMKFLGGPPPVAKTPNMPSSAKVDPKDIDWLAVQNKVLGYKKQTITPWEPVKPEERTLATQDEHSLGPAKPVITLSAQAVQGGTAEATKVKDTCADGQDCKWTSMWEPEPVKVEEPAAH